MPTPSTIIEYLQISLSFRCYAFHKMVGLVIHMNQWPKFLGNLTYSGPKEV